MGRFMEEMVISVIAEMEKSNIPLTEENIKKAVDDEFDQKNKERSQFKMQAMKEWE